MGIIFPRNRLVFPSGARSEINREHPAYSARLRYAGVPFGNSFVNLVNGKLATVAAGSPAAVVAPLTGAAINFPSGAGLASTVPQDTPVRGVTVAGIFTPTSTSTSFGTIFVTGSGIGGSNDWGIVLQSGFIQVWANGSNNRLVTVPAFTANKPYFAAFCIYPQSSTNLQIAEVVTDLTTGQVYYATGTGTQSFNPIGSTTFDIGSWAGSNSSLAKISAVMYSTDAVSPQALLQWAHDPWAFWYPQSTKRSLLGLQAVPSFVPPGNGKGAGKGNGGNGKPPKGGGLQFDPYGRYEAYFEGRDEQANLRRARRRSALYGTVFDSTIALNVAAAVSAIGSISFDKAASLNLVAALAGTLGSSFDVAAALNIVAALSNGAVLSLSPAASLGAFLGQISAPQLDAGASASLNLVARASAGAAVDVQGAATFNTVVRASAAGILTAEAAATLAAIVATAVAAQMDATAAVTLNLVASALALGGRDVPASATINTVLGHLAKAAADLASSATFNTGLGAQIGNSITIDGAVSLGALLGAASLGGADLNAEAAITVTLRADAGASIEADAAAAIIASLGVRLHPNAPKPIADLVVLQGIYDTRLVLTGVFQTATDLSGTFEITIAIDGRTLN